MAGESSKPESIFFAALEKPTDEERAAYLDQACGQDTDLRRRVEKLLAAQPHVGTFLEEPVTDHPSSSGSQEGPGSVIGSYKLLQEIGEGGFGIVYMAEQLEPVRRHVALKIIKPGMDTREVIARFEAERQALALMDHSNIARIFDAGATKSGRPYFVMELVKGVPITEFCDKNNFDTEKRLELFMTVCRAVQHAHQKGVIHRDIKPSNIMITLHDGDPVPKVIDFGVSKAISQRLTEKTLFTRYGQMIGTPQYMSPEQAEMSGLDVDTRSDVYSLGVLLYELLTGTTPLEGEKLRTAGYAEMVRMIQSEEPAKPSTRVSSLGDSQTVVCQQRSTDAKRLHQLFRGDLDWIVMKALEKHRDRRYETASEFARDIARHLNDEPVHAGPPSATYLLSKIVRRNKVAVFTVSCVLAALIIGLAAAIWGFANARHHRGIAEEGQTRAKLAEQEAISQRDDARASRIAAEVAGKETAIYADRMERHLYNIHLAEADEAVRRKAYRECLEKLEFCPPGKRGWEWSFVRQRLAVAPFSFPGIGKPIYTPDGGRLISLGLPGSVDEFNVLIRDATTGKIVGKFESGGNLSVMAMSSDGKLLAAGGDDGTLTVWDAATQRIRWTKRENEYRMLGMAIGTDGLIAVADASGGLTVFDAADESVKFKTNFPTLAPSSERPTEATLPTQGNEASSVANPRPKWNRVQFSPDGKWMALGSHTFHGVGGRLHVDRKGSLIIIIDVSTRQIVAEFEDGYFLPTFSPDSKTIATAIKDDTFRIVLWNWDGKTKTLTQNKSWQVSDDPENTIMDFSFRAESTHLAALERRNVKIWDVETGKEIAKWDGATWRADWLTMHPTKDQVAFVKNDRNVQEWNYAEGQSEVIKVKLPQGGKSIKISPDGEWIAIGAGKSPTNSMSRIGNERIIIVRAATGVIRNSFDGTMTKAPWFPDSSRLAVVRGPTNRVEIVNSRTGELEHFLEETGKIQTNIRGAIWPFVSEDGRVVTTVTRNRPVKNEAGWIRTWDASTGGLLKEFQFTCSVGWTGTSVDVNHKTNRVAIGAKNRRVEIWDTESASLSRTVRTPGVIHFAIDLSADGERLYIGEYGNELTVHDFDTEREIEFGGVNGGYFAFSPNGKQVVVNNKANKRTLVVCDVETTRPLITLLEGRDLGPVDWSSDGKRIAAAGKDDLYIWTLPQRP